MAKTSIAILGGRGMLGTDLAKQCFRCGFSVKVLDLPEFNITNPSQLKQAVDSSDVIINCAAYTNVDGAETDTDLAYAVNAKAVGDLGDLAAKSNKWILHISTDFVFDGQSDKPYRETDQTNPINEYGKSKLAGEQLLIENNCPCCIMRVQWTYGLAGKNFVTKLLELTKTRKELKVVSDQIGSPTSTVEAAKAVCQLIEKRPQGIFHFASDGFVSRFDMAKFIFDKMNIAINLKSCGSDEFQAPAKRPLNSRFNCEKIKSILSEPIRNWQGPLEEFLRLL